MVALTIHANAPHGTTYKKGTDCPHNDGLCLFCL